MKRRLSAPETVHSKYLHVYAIVRFDQSSQLENCATVVKVFASRAPAEQEAERLRQVNKGKLCTYTVQITRLVGALSEPVN
jgi:hypothetical protein